MAWCSQRNGSEEENKRGSRDPDGYTTPFAVRHGGMTDLKDGAVTTRPHDRKKVRQGGEGKRASGGYR